MILLERSRGIIKNFIRCCPLLKQLVLREIKVKYRRSFLGIIWTVLNPLLNMLVITMVFSQIFRFQIENYQVYYLSGSILFNFTIDTTTQSMHSIIGNGGLIKKVYIPKYVFPLAKVLVGTVNFGYSAIALLIVMLLTNVPITTSLLMTFFLLPALFMFTYGISLVLSALAVFFRDVLYLYSIFSTLWIYLTPVFYPIDILPDNILSIVQRNPMYHFVTYFRELCLYGTIPDSAILLQCYILGGISLLVGFIFFYRSQDKFILYI